MSLGDAGFSSSVPTDLTGRMTMKGALDASANPNYPSAVAGDTYVVSAAGKVGGAAGVAVQIGDEIVASAANAGGTQAGVGASWFIVAGNKNLPIGKTIALAAGAYLN